MATQIKAPQFPEAVADGTVATWHKQPGDAVAREELLVDIETDKIVLEIVAPADGVLTEIIKGEGEVIDSQELIAMFEEGAKATGSAPAATESESASAQSGDDQIEDNWGPAVRKLIAENNIDPSKISGTGKGGRITKEDVVKFMEGGATKATSAPAKTAPAAKTAAPKSAPGGAVNFDAGDREERRVPMTRLRARVAERLVEAQQTAAMLTTFNEVNMKPVMEMRKNYKDQFEKAHGVRLGFMSFFIKAAVEDQKSVV